MSKAKATPARGFAGMTPEQRREISARGGRSAAAKGVGHRFNSDTARAAATKMQADRKAAKAGT